ncbi:MAG: TRAP transporter substrate-binding protein DctP [Clostridiales bacterium]|nr:TRAP transporter substrate-binding protein DctP [Clostridiales bacterium]
MKKNILLLYVILVTAVCLLVACSGDTSLTSTQGGNGSAASPAGDSSDFSITLRVADHLPPEHPYMFNGSVTFMNLIEERTGGRVTFEHFPAEQAGAMRDQMNMVQTKIVDIAGSPASIFADQVPLSNVVNLPGWQADTIQLTKAYYDLATDPDSAIYKNDFAKNKVRMLYCGCFPLYQIQTSKFSVKSMGDLAGKRIRSSGGSMELVLKALGAVPISIPPTELYESMQRSTIDGMYSPQESIVPQKLHEVTKYSTANMDLNAFIMLWVINEEVWQSLPSDIQQILSDTAKEVSYAFPEKLLTEFDKARMQMEEYGIEFTELSQAELDRMNMAVENVASDWVKQMDGQGFDGSGTFEAYAKALDKYK